jgi:lipoate-protein ligase A
MPPLVEEAAFANRWRLLDLSLASAHRNLAVEEALVTEKRGSFEPTIRLWVNPPTAVLGRFQYAETEVDIEQCRKDNVQIVRRFTGGGAVFHDQGNLNFTLAARRVEGTSLLEFHQTNASVLMGLLNRLGLEGNYVPPNSITISGKKIAGAAAALNRSHALWHASMLVSTDTLMLERILSPSKEKNKGQFIRSNWMPVITLEEALGKSIKVEDVKTELIDFLIDEKRANLEIGILSKEEEGISGKLFEKKYSSERWNLFGIY